MIRPIWLDSSLNLRPCSSVSMITLIGRFFRRNLIPVSGCVARLNCVDPLGLLELDAVNILLEKAPAIQHCATQRIDATPSDNA